MNVVSTALLSALLAPPMTSLLAFGSVTMDMHSRRGGIRTLMVTGDYHHTALAIATDVGMLQPDCPVMVIDTLQDSPTAADISPLQQNVAASDQQQSAVLQQPSWAQADGQAGLGMQTQSGAQTDLRGESQSSGAVA